MVGCPIDVAEKRQQSCSSRCLGVWSFLLLLLGQTNGYVEGCSSVSFKDVQRGALNLHRFVEFTGPTEITLFSDDSSSQSKNSTIHSSGSSPSELASVHEGKEAALTSSIRR